MTISHRFILVDIPFETEEELRAKGTSRTPDILFSCPMAVKVHKRLLSNSRHGIGNVTIDEHDSNYIWKMVCWIDSKVRFILTRNSCSRKESFPHFLFLSRQCLEM